METLTRELTDVRQQLKQREAELEMKVVAMKQQMEENQTLAAQIDRIEHESTAKIEVLCYVFVIKLYTEYKHEVLWYLQKIGWLNKSKSLICP